ncbi:MAG: MFS transporter [Advenella sp.]
MSRQAAIRIFVLFALGYFLSYVYRGLNIGFAPFLSREMNLTASDLGLLTSFYFIGFALAQLPAGLALDRYGARRTDAVLLLVAAAGTVLYGMTDTMQGLIIGRIMIGVGVSVCLGAGFLAIAQNFPSSRWPLLNGLMVALGGMGGVVVGTPLAVLLTHYTWREVSIGMAVFTIAVAVVIWLLVPESKQRMAPHEPVSKQIHGVRIILKNAVFWRVVPFPCAVGGAFYAAQSLWVKPYLTDVSGLTARQADSLVSMLGLTMVAGTVITGLVARRIERYGLGLRAFCGLGMTLFVLVQLLILLRVPLSPALIWGTYGFLAASCILAYALLAEVFPRKVVGRVTTAFNMIFFISIFSMQVGVGFVLDFWPATDGHYPAVAHLTGWGIMIAIQLVSAILYFWPGALKVDERLFE